MTRTEIGAYLIIDSGICHGQMTFNGTRIPMDTILTCLGKGISLSDTSCHVILNGSYSQRYDRIQCSFRQMTLKRSRFQ